MTGRNLFTNFNIVLRMLDLYYRCTESDRDAVIELKYNCRILPHQDHDGFTIQRGEKQVIYLPLDLNFGFITLMPGNRRLDLKTHRGDTPVNLLFMDIDWAVYSLLKSEVEKRDWFGPLFQEFSELEREFFGPGYAELREITKILRRRSLEK